MLPAAHKFTRHGFVRQARVPDKKTETESVFSHPTFPPGQLTTTRACDLVEESRLDLATLETCRYVGVC